MLKKFKSDQYFTALILVIGVLLTILSGALARFDNIFYDVGLYLTAPNPPEDVVIVAIDERSLDIIGKWPWPRDVHANLISQLHESKPLAIGLDILFSEADLVNPQQDQKLVNAIQLAANVVLPVVIDSPYQDARLTLNTSMPELIAVAASTGRVNVPLDNDGIARSIYLWEGISTNHQNALGLPHFSQSVLSVAGLLPLAYQKQPPYINLDVHKSDKKRSLAQTEHQKVRFFGKPGHFKQVSYVSVLQGGVPKKFFDEKIVLVGATAVGMGDLLPTPMSGFTKPMSGVEFNANVIESMRRSEMITQVPTWISGVIAIVFVLIPLIWLPKLRPFFSLLMILVYLTMMIIVAVLLPAILNLWVPPSPIFLMILLIYPIWSWRRLDRAHDFLELEFAKLNDDFVQFGFKSMDDAALANLNDQKLNRYDLLQTHIGQLHSAGQLLRDLQKSKNETLAFISHDLRMPLSTASMMLKEPDFMRNREQIVSVLDDAHALADNFLNISKAQTVNRADFKELELNSLLQEVIDQLYPFAKSKNIKLKLILSETPLWVSGDFSLLQRAYLNVVNNAVKFSHADNLVEIKLSQNNPHAVVQVKDFGVGIPQDKLETVFKQYSRLQVSQKMAQGSGLGLYFVDETFKKHRGEISVKSELGYWTIFTIELPLVDSFKD